MAKEVINEGDTFNHWTVLKQAETRKMNEYYACECVCGTKREVFRGSLIGGRSKSCGCQSIGKNRREI